MKNKPMNNELITCPYCNGKQVWTDAHGVILEGNNHCPACHGSGTYPKKDYEKTTNTVQGMINVMMQRPDGPAKILANARMPYAMNPNGVEKELSAYMTKWPDELEYVLSRLKRDKQ